MRPLYETNEHLSKENDLKVSIEKAWKVRLHKLPIHWRADYIVSNRRGACVGLAELKCRNITSTQYPTFIISEKKISFTYKLISMFGYIDHPELPAAQAPILRTRTYKPIPLLIMVRCLDKDLYYKFDPAHLRDGISFIEENGGRTKNTRDDKDIENVIHIPWTLFKPFPNA